MILTGGVTRRVLLIGNYAVKVPRWRYGWRMFLTGLISNMAETRFKSLSDHFHLCPVLFSIPGGWLNIMPRCTLLTDREWDNICARCNPENDPTMIITEWYGFDCDFKRDNFGVLDGRVVLLDYGEIT